MSNVKKIKRRSKIANYIKVNDAFELMGAGFSELNEATSAKTTSKRYVNDNSETKRIVGYDWKTAFNTDMIRSESVIEYICKIGEYQLVGSDCETEYIMVDLESKLSGTKFKARKINVAIEVASFNDNDGEMGVSGNLLGIGDIIIGSFDITNKTFTEGEETPSSKINLNK